MANKVIQFTVSADGAISPKVEQAAGVQGAHNVTEVKFNVSALASLYADANADGEAKTRIQIIDGAGGFYSTGFLEVSSEDNNVSCEIPSTVTNAGGVAKVYLVVTKIVYEENGLAVEDKVFISSAGKLSFEGSGVGSPSEYQYRKGISSALVNAETFVRLAEEASEEAEDYKNDAEVFKDAAATSATNAANSLQELRDGIANGKFKGEPGPQGPQGPQGVQGEKGEPGETPSLDGVIQFWQKNTEYKVGDVVIANLQEGLAIEDHFHASVPSRTVIARCISQHLPQDYLNLTGGSIDPDEGFVEAWEILQEVYGYYDALGRGIHNTYATKEELAEAIGQALEGDY